MVERFNFWLAVRLLMQQTILILENDIVRNKQVLSTIVADLIRDRVQAEIFEPNSGFRYGIPQSISGVVVGGGLPSVNDDLEWIEDEIALIKQAMSLRIPVFGICFGHQLLGKMFGVDVVRRGRRTGFANIAKSMDARILEGTPDSWRSPVYHQDRIEIVPDGFELIATSDYCIVQGMQHRMLPIFSFQFHPEICFGINEKFSDPVDEWNNESVFESAVNLRIIDNFVDICLSADHE
jgi:GMP synthase-like glutamine amidotransferase